ncbi:MAG: DUF2961 domain-containing protein [Sandaracinaceae bacterium]|nr:DUF2961 domain-containing protein [Sandaracinaceae bacterium]
MTQGRHPHPSSRSGLVTSRRAAGLARTGLMWTGLARTGLMGAGLLAGCPGPAPNADAGAARDAARLDANADAGTSAPRVDLVADLADPYAPARLRPGTPFLVSSREPEPPEGELNRDHSYFVREEDGRGVMIDREGPGVITRWWMTIGDLPNPDDPDGVRVRFWVDDQEIDPDGGETGITLGELTSGRHEGLAEPFTLDRAGTSGGFVVSQPLHYQRSFRADVALSGGWTYYQLEGTDLPEGTEVTPFAYPVDAEGLASLEAASLLWRDHDHPGVDRMGDASPLAAGAAAELSWMGPGVATSVVLEVPRADREDVTLVIEADGVEAVHAPLAWLSGGDAPAAPTHRSALFEVDPEIVVLHHPIPFAEDLVVRLVAEGRSIDRVRVGGRVVMGPLDDDLGRLRTDCRAHEAVASISMCGTTDPSLRAPNHVVGAWSGARGHYAGHSLVQRVSSSWWCALEPDHEVWIDGTYALLGTGTEDYYSAGFYFHEGPIAWTLAGASGWTRSDVDASAATHLYRHHLVDTIPFESELRFEFESYVDDTTFTGCAFFYIAPE